MSQVQLIYASTASKILTLEDLKDILATAARCNKEHRITGFLCADKHYFVQCIEGEKSAIDQLYQNIQKDYRHHSLEILRYEEITIRAFPEWAMAAVLDMERHQKILSKFRDDDSFQPYTLSSENSLRFLQEFSKLRGMIQEEIPDD